MKRMLALLVTLSLLCCGTMAQDDHGLVLASSAPVFRITLDEGTLFARHTDGAVTAIDVESIMLGSVQVSLYASPEGDADVQGYPADTPKLTTSWCDKKGATHTVSTPVASSTPAGIARAKKTHQALVAMMQQLYPPKT